MLRGSLAAGGALLGAKGMLAQQDGDGEPFIPPPSPVVAPFQRRLPIPRLHVPLNRPGATAGETARAYHIYQSALAEDRFKHGAKPPLDDVDYYDVVARPGIASIIPGMQTPIWGYNGQFPGPTFLTRRNRTVVVRLTNRVDEIVSMHNHGGHTPPDSDGTPMLSYNSVQLPPLQGGIAGSRTYVFPNDNEFPATMWYHDHGLHVTAANVYRGLAGFFLLNAGDGPEDEQFRMAEQALPNGYGRYDIPMVFQDRRFNADGSLLYNTFDHDGIVGDRFLVNGVIQPYFPVARRKYRFRWLNGSNARVYELHLSTGERMTQIGTDGALLPEPVERRSIKIAPAERYEVVIDFSEYPIGTRLYLVNALRQDTGRKPEDDADFNNGTPLVEFRVNRDEEDPSWVPDDLNPGVTAYIDEYLNPDNPVNPGTPIPVRDVVLGRRNGTWTVNDRFFDRNRVDIFETLNTQSIWRLSNPSGGWVHPIHIHDMQFRLLDRNGRPPDAGEAGLKDVFFVGEEETLRVMCYWAGPKNVGRYVFHCHNLEHEDMSMMGMFEVRPPEGA
jgi:FtsP/CotA-like multicopper oxidase with cupredoxin domain